MMTRRSLHITGVFLFFAGTGAAVHFELMPPAFFLVYALVSLWAFFLYGRDKAAARKGAWRVQERTLHLVNLAGGWPGAMLARQLFRHKTKKQPFVAIFWVTSLLNLLIFFWLFSTQGQQVSLQAAAHIESGVDWVQGWGLLAFIKKAGFL